MNYLIKLKYSFTFGKRSIVLSGLILLITIQLLFESCATIISGSKQEILFSSNPPVAQIYVNNTLIGNTPMVYPLKRNSVYMVKIALEGYHDEEIKIKRGFNGWTLGNILLGGVIGIIVDVATGAVYTLKPDQLNPILSKKSKDFFGWLPAENNLIITLTEDTEEFLSQDDNLLLLTTLTMR